MAETAWRKLDMLEQRKALDAIDTHIKYWETMGTAKEFICHASTWLNQARYEDEIEIEQPKQQSPKLVAWWTSDAGIMAKGKELGIEPRPGETMYTFKDRVADRVRVAA
jgi:hypothetical protein